MFNLALLGAISLGSAGAAFLLIFLVLYEGWRHDSNQENARANRVLALTEMQAMTEADIATKRAELVYPDERGALPLSFSHVIQATVREQILLLQSQLIESQRTYPDVPNTIHYSVANDQTYLDGPAGEQPTELQPLTPNDVMRFGDAFQQGVIAKGRIFAGWNVITHEPVYLNGIDHIESLIFAGESTSGKSNSARAILTQLAMMGAKILLSDRHAGHERSLAFGMGALHGCLAQPIAKTPDATVALVEYAYQEFMMRVGEVDRDHTALHGFDPLILVIDEFTALLKLKGMFDALYDKLNTLIIESAKYKVLVQLIGQNWSSVSTGGRADLRQSFQSRMVHKVDSEQARLMISTEASRHSEELPKGQAFFKDATGRTHFVQMPLCEAADIELALDSTGTWSEPKALSLPIDSNVRDNVQHNVRSNCQCKPNIETPNIETNIATNIDEQKERRILLAIKQGRTVSDIIRDVYGITTRGDASMKATREINEVISYAFLGSLTETTYRSLDELGLLILGAFQDGQTINEMAESFGKRPSPSYMTALDNIYSTIREVIS